MDFYTRYWIHNRIFNCNRKLEISSEVTRTSLFTGT